MVPGGSPAQPGLGRADHLDAGPRIGELDVLLLADAQTSGGLLFGAGPHRAPGRWRS